MAGSCTAGFADGTTSATQFKYPYGIAVDGNGTVHVSEVSNNRICVVIK